MFLSAAVMLSAVQVFAQNVVTGTVTDDNGEPLIGAGVTYVGTTVGVVTDLDGKYSIERRPGETLQFSSIGMISSEVVVSDQKEINIRLETDNLVLEDAVVIGYGSLSRADLTGSVSSFKSEELAKTGSSNVVGALQGHVAGLNIDTLDLGVPVISMHAPYELISKADLYSAYQAFKTFNEN